MHAICRVNQAEYEFPIPMAAPQKYVKTYSTRRIRSLYHRGVNPTHTEPKKDTADGTARGDTYPTTWPVVSSRCHTCTPIDRLLFLPTTHHSSQLTFSDQWFGPSASTHEGIGSTPGSTTFPFAVCGMA